MTDTHDHGQQPRPYGFTVQRHDNHDHPDAAPNGIPTWAVHLPHQCDTWDIAGDGSWSGVPHAEAISELERFIAEAQVALAALRAEQPIGETRDDTDD